MQQRPKLPWLAAILNFILPGAGYVYVGTRLRFGVLLLASMAIAIFAPPMENAADTTQVNLETYIQDPGFLAIMISGLLIAAAFAYDAWGDAKDYNQSLGPAEEESDLE